MFCSSTFNTYASTTTEIMEPDSYNQDTLLVEGRARQTITIPALGTGEKKLSATRSGKNAFVSVNCYAVYPIGSYESDNFTKMRVRIRNANLTKISSEVILDEGAGAQSIELYDSLISETPQNIYFCFYGNSANYDAKADVGYDAR